MTMHLTAYHCSSCRLCQSHPLRCYLFPISINLLWQVLAKCPLFMDPTLHALILHIVFTHTMGECISVLSACVLVLYFETVLVSYNGSARVRSANSALSCYIDDSGMSSANFLQEAALTNSNTYQTQLSDCTSSALQRSANSGGTTCAICNFPTQRFVAMM